MGEKEKVRVRRDRTISSHRGSRSRTSSRKSTPKKEGNSTSKMEEMRRNRRALIKMGSVFGRRTTPRTKGVELVRKEEALVTHTQTGSAQAESNKSSTTTARKKGKRS